MKNDENLIILQNKGLSLEDTLTEEEKDLKDKLINIQKKLNSTKKVIKLIEKQSNYTIFDYESFEILITSIAISTATSEIENYFDLNNPKKKGK